MADSKKKRDKHKVPQLQVRLHPLLRKQLKSLATRNLSTMSAEVTAAIRRYLAENDLWPPPTDPPKGKPSGT